MLIISLVFFVGYREILRRERSSEHELEGRVHIGDHFMRALCVAFTYVYASWSRIQLAIDREDFHRVQATEGGVGVVSAAWEEERCLVQIENPSGGCGGSNDAVFVVLGQGVFCRAVLVEVPHKSGEPFGLNTFHFVHVLILSFDSIPSPTNS